jgi:hypothetical protein
MTPNAQVFSIPQEFDEWTLNNQNLISLQMDAGVFECLR